MTEDEATFCKMCAEILGDEWSYYSNQNYNFPAAYRYGLTPEAAVKDCREWVKRLEK